MRRDVLGDLDRHAHALHALEIDARDSTLFHAGHEHGVALLQARDALEHHVEGDAAGAERLSCQPKHADEEHREPDQHDRPNPHFLFVGQVHYLLPVPRTLPMRGASASFA